MKITERLPTMFMLIQGTVPVKTPMMMAPQPATKPAAGVMPTRPVIMPFMEPMMDGLPKKMMSMTVHVSSDMAVQMLVFSTAAPASGEAEYGSPPLKPFQPIQRMPAPTIMSGMLLGVKFSLSFFRRGPIQYEPTKAAVPDDRWIT